MLDEQKLQELTKDFNESFEEIKSEFLKLTTDELNALKIHELVKAATDIGQLFGEATILFRMGLITVEKYNFTVRMTNIIESCQDKRPRTFHSRTPQTNSSKRSHEKSIPCNTTRNV